MKTYKLLSIALTLLIPAIILAQPGIDYFEKNHPPEHILNLSDKQNIDHRMKFRALLTDEQKLNLKNLKFEKKRMPMMNKRKMQSNHFHGYQGRNTRQNPNQSLKHRNK